MARIAMRSGFTLVPEGTHVFRIFNVTYDEEFGKLTVFMVDGPRPRRRDRREYPVRWGSRCGRER